ncbi:MAG: hypothetical protein HYY06_12705 [Deltaproteobacteria bacterium]|nr:hypothetical protein [Deltaproteobacteria bacterium]
MEGQDGREIWVEVEGIQVGLVDDARAVIVRGPDGRYVHDHSLCGFLAGHVCFDEARFHAWAKEHVPLLHRAVARGRRADSAGTAMVDDWGFPDDPFAFARPWFGEINEPPARIDVGAIQRDFLGQRPRLGADQVPELVVIGGPVASGKTTLRRASLASHVPIDPGELYRLLTIGETKVPANIGRLLQEAGRDVALAALRERRDVVLEVLPSHLARPLVLDILPRIKALGYRTRAVYCTAPLDVTLERNRKRAWSEISAVRTEVDACAWVRYALGEIERETGGTGARADNSWASVATGERPDGQGGRCAP